MSTPLTPDAARALLGSRGWLSAVPADFRDAFLGACRPRSIAAGELFSLAGDDAAAGLGIYGVVSGQVAVTSAMNSAEAPVGLLFNPGGWGGYAPLIRPVRLANSRATTATMILHVSIAEVRRMLADRPDWWQPVATLTFEAGLVYARIAVDLLLNRTDRRLAAILLHQSGCRHAGQPADLHLSQIEIAEMINLSRYPTRRLLAAFEERGWLAQSYRRIKILDPAQLRRLADGG